jgi:hypothetical protein
MAKTILHGLFTVAATEFTVASTATGNDAGSYYIYEYGGGTNDLMAHLTAKMAAVDATATVTLSSAGKVVIAFGGVQTVSWSVTTLRDILGFTGNLSGAATYTATNYPRYTWVPTREMAEYPTNAAQLWATRSTTLAHRSIDGTTFTVNGNLVYDGNYSWRLNPLAEVLIAHDTAYNSFEQFFTDVMAVGKPIIVYPDTTAYATHHHAIMPGNDEEGIGSFTDYAFRVVTGSSALWDIEFPLWKKI